MSGACGVYGGEERFIQVFGEEKLRERNNLEDTGAGGRILLKWSSRIGMGTWTGLIWFRIGSGGGRL
jgi:hypothetical protein